MRPGQEAPDAPVGALDGDKDQTASMRPGQEAPDARTGVGLRCRRDLASMRPGQEAPDAVPRPAPYGPGSPRFNEAGARSPGCAFATSSPARLLLALQ